MDIILLEHKMTKRDSNFSIEYTNYAKGIAVILLLVHHFIFIPFHIPFQSGDWHELAVLFCKVCVPLFSVLSGYGITKSYIKNSKIGQLSDGKFVFYHLKKLLINYWWVYLPVLMLSLTVGFRGYPWEVYGTGIKGILYFLLDFTGLRAALYSPTYCNTWWFIEVTLLFYAIFPLLYKFYKKLPVVAMGILLIPLVLRLFMTFPQPFNKTDREMYYLFSFAVGMVLADKNILDNAVEYSHKHKAKFALNTLAALPASMALAAYVNLIGMLLFALAIIMAVICMKSFPFHLGRFWEFLGKYSMNVFLIHSLYMSYVKQYIVINALNRPLNMIIQFIFILVTNFALAYILELIKKHVRLFISRKNKEAHTS